ncbi:transporter [Bacillus cereus]|uniref:Transport permease protein n=1 Tax=Bacillus cereus TaxID=1396 RepID=A0A2B4A299_BACCE|nr:ABC transporter permease [Bacillus cereus]PEC86559.1 transporter [Bacillus cereus]PEX38488.1 transporter [Bacillus cereus]PFB16426.1 transporter [Bacillus cereus]PFC72661.1 transporter [Bacillus cereus]PFD72510.1 transporter [Bacillus cereus]
MKSLFYLISRNNKIYRRDRTLLLLSLLSVFIVILLYAVFLQQTQIDAIKKVVDLTTASKAMVNEWMVAGLLSITAVTTTLGAFGIMVKDKESKKAFDFLTAPLSRATIQLSYVVNSFVIGLFFSLLALVGCEIFLVLTGSEVLSGMEMLKVIGIIILSVALSSSINLFLVLFINTQNAFSTLSTVVGTAIGFLCGVYVPIGGVPNFVQNIIMYFPISHTAVLLRDIFMKDSIQTVFKQATPEQILEYKTHYGIVYELNDKLVSTAYSLWMIIITMVVFTVVSIMIFKRQNK